MGPIDFACTYDPRLGLYGLNVAGRRFTMTEAVFAAARSALRQAAAEPDPPARLTLDLGGQMLNLEGAGRHEYATLLGLFDAAARGAADARRAEGN